MFETLALYESTIIMNRRKTEDSVVYRDCAVCLYFQTYKVPIR